MKKIILLSILILTSGLIFASGEYENEVFIDDANTAVGGWDSVSFFTDAEPVEGDSAWSLEYKDALWMFSSEENLELFRAEPEKYAPAYGGYCAWAMNEGKLAPGKPDHWDIIDGRLYLNYSSSTRKKFLADIDNMIINADVYWPDVKARLISE